MDSMENKLQILATKIYNNLYSRHSKEKQNCLPFARIVQINLHGNELTKKELEHIQVCQNCEKHIENALLKVTGIIARENLLAAAGSHDELKDICGETIAGSGLGKEMTIICEHETQGYAIRIESSTPVTMVLVFMREQEELCRIEINEQIPENLVALESIKGWTTIQLLRKD